MQMIPTTSAELANFPYLEIQPGVYSHQPTGRILFVETDESAILIIRNVAGVEVLGRP